MRRAKKFLFKVHSWIGIQMGILFYIVCLSGTLATLSHEMDYLFNPAIRADPMDRLAPRNLILDNFKKAYPNGKIDLWQRANEPYLCDLIYKVENGARNYVFANPYTGAIQGEAQITFARFFRDLHYYLFIPSQIGHFIVLFFGFQLLISLGTALAFYKKWWRKLFELQTDKGILVFFRSGHRLIGLWTVPFTILFSLTGIWYFLERTDTANISTTSNPKRPKIQLTTEEMEVRSYTFDSMKIDYDLALQKAEQAIPGMRAGDISPPKTYRDVIYITGFGKVPLVRARANRVYVDPMTYEVLAVQDAQHLGTVMYLNDIADPMHFGYWGGLTTKFIWFILGLGISSLVFSGLYITAKRKAIKRKKKNQNPLGPWWFINWGLIGIVLFYMFHNLVNRYNVSTSTIVGLAMGLIFLLFMAWYLFFHKLRGHTNQG